MLGSFTKRIYSLNFLLITRVYLCVGVCGCACVCVCVCVVVYQRSIALAEGAKLSASSGGDPDNDQVETYLPDSLQGQAFA